MFHVEVGDDVDEIARVISAELRTQYVIGYHPTSMQRDGKWRKVKVKLVPPQGLPSFTLHARSGYYAPLY